MLLAESMRSASTLYKKNGLTLPQTVLLLNEHTDPSEIPALMAAIADRPAALISDGGLPVIADPGAEIVRNCHRSGWPVEIIAGGTAAAAALALAGLGNKGYTFAGFLPRDKESRLAAIRGLSYEAGPVVLYEAPYRYKAVLADLAGELRDPGLSVFVALELGAGTKYVDVKLEALGTVLPGLPAGRPVIIIYREAQGLYNSQEGRKQKNQAWQKRKKRN